MQHLLFQRRAALSVFCLGLSLLFPVASASARLNPPSKTPNIIQVRLSSAPQTLDWNRATSGSESAILRNIMDGLFSFEDGHIPVPNLAKSFTWSEDRKTLEITLQKNAVWTDGVPLKAQQFVDSFERLLNPQLNSPNAALLFDVTGARDYFFGKTKNFADVGVLAVRDDLLRITLLEPRANFLNILTHWATDPVRKDKLVNNGIPTSTLTPTLGAYRLVKEVVHGDEHEITLTENTSYFGTHPVMKQVVFKVYANGLDALHAYRKGKLDYLLQVEDQLLDAQKLNQEPGIGFVNPVRVVALLHLNPSRVNTNTPEKRLAIMAAIPVAPVIAQSPNTRIAANSIIPQGMNGSPDPFTVLPKANPAIAKSPLPDEALTLAYPKDTLSQSIAEEIQTAAAAQGKLKIIAEPLPDKALVGANTLAKRYDLVLTLFGLDYYDPDQLFSSFLSQGTQDLFNLSSAELLSLLQQARNTTDEREQGQIYAKAAQYLQAKIAVVMPLFYRRRAYLLRPKFQMQKGSFGSAKIQKIK